MSSRGGSVRKRDASGKPSECRISHDRIECQENLALTRAQATDFTAGQSELALVAYLRPFETSVTLVTANRALLPR